MAKVFNVEQLRLNKNLLTGNAAGELFYDGNQMAQGSSAVPNDRKLKFTAGISYSDGTDEKDLSADRIITVNVDNSTIGVNGSDNLYVKDASINWNHLHGDVAGPGLGGGDSSNLYVNTDDSSLEVSADEVRVKALGVTNAMLAGSIVDSKLNQITTVGKVQGGAVTLENTTLDTGVGKGLRISAGGVGVTEINAAIAGNGLQGGGGSSIDVVPAVNSGIAVSATEIGVSLLGVTNGMLAGSIANGKLLQIAATDMVDGGAVKHNDTLDVTSNDLHIADGGVTEQQIHSNTFGNGINGGSNVVVTADPGSGIVVNAVGINIGQTGVITSMIKDLNVTNAKLASDISIGKTDLAAGDGLVFDGSTLDVGGGDGITANADDVAVDATVVRTNATQTLAGDYTFSNEVNFDSNIIVDGDLTVKGETILIDSQTVNIGDNIIVLNADFAGAPAGAPDAGIEIERGTATNNAFVLFDEPNDMWKAGLATAGGSDPAAEIYQIDTAEFSRSYSCEVKSGECNYALDFKVGSESSFAFPSVPSVTCSIQHTGKYSVANPDMLGVMVTGIYDTGVHLQFTAETPHSGYYINVHASSVGEVRHIN